MAIALRSHEQFVEVDQECHRCVSQAVVCRTFRADGHAQERRRRVGAGRLDFGVCFAASFVSLLVKKMYCGFVLLLHFFSTAAAAAVISAFVAGRN